jgi:uncharacterized integral membrane protein
VADDQTKKPDRAARQPPNPRIVLAGVAGVLLVLIAVLNLDRVRFDWIVDSFRAPLIVVIAVSALLGFVIGYVLRAHRSR